MNHYRRQRQMDFILNSLAQLSATTNKLAESQVRDAERLARLEDSFVGMTVMLNRHEDRYDLMDNRIIQIESCSVLLIQLIRKLRKRLQYGEKNNHHDLSRGGQEQLGDDVSDDHG